MAAIIIKDLRTNRTLDSQAMSAIRGAGGGWLFGWMRPHIVASNGPIPANNFYFINIFAEQIINQFQTVEVQNSAPNSTVNVAVDERSVNNKL